MPIPRQKISLVRDRLRQFPAAALLRPRQVGQTTLARQVAASLASLCPDLERQADRAKLANAEIHLSEHEDRLAVLGDIQRTPDILSTLRGRINRGRARAF